MADDISFIHSFDFYSQKIKIPHEICEMGHPLKLTKAYVLGAQHTNKNIPNIKTKTKQIIIKVIVSIHEGKSRVVLSLGPLHYVANHLSITSVLRMMMKTDE